MVFVELGYRLVNTPTARVERISEESSVKSRADLKGVDKVVNTTQSGV